MFCCFSCNGSSQSFGFGSEFSQTLQEFPETDVFANTSRCCVTSPLGVPDGFGEDVVPPVEVHDAVLQVELPLVLTPVNLGTTETNVSL